MTDPEIQSAFEDALAKEKRGEWEYAIQVYEKLAAELRGTENGASVLLWAYRLREKQAQLAAEESKLSLARTQKRLEEAEARIAEYEGRLRLKTLRRLAFGNTAILFLVLVACWWTLSNMVDIAHRLKVLPEADTVAGPWVPDPTPPFQAAKMPLDSTPQAPEQPSQKPLADEIVVPKPMSDAAHVPGGVAPPTGGGFHAIPEWGIGMPNQEPSGGEKVKTSSPSFKIGDFPR